MPGLPDRPDPDQLRRQARELLRAAVSGEPAAVARIRVISERMMLSAAQQALAREYGYRNWAALRAEVERRRSPAERWSFGGAAAIETLSGTLLPEGLVVGVDGALLFTALVLWNAPSDDDPWSESRWDESASIDDLIRALEPSTRTDDITVADSQGATYALSLLAASGAPGASPRSMRFRIDPIPERGLEWIELRGRNGTTARLLRSPRAVTRLGRLTPVPNDDKAGPTDRAALTGAAALTAVARTPTASAAASVATATRTSPWTSPRASTPSRAACT